MTKLPNKAKVVIIGGGYLFRESINYFNKLVITLVDCEIENGDIFYPEIDLRNWKLEKEDEVEDSFYKDEDEFEIILPMMPLGWKANYEEWKIWFERHFEYLHDGVIMIGCSLGAMFLYKYYSENQLPFKTKELILMASPVPELLPAEEKDCGDFVYLMADLNKLIKQSQHITIMHSKDDFVVPYEHALKYKEVLPEAELVTFEDKNHFLVEELPELVERIRDLS